jgi:hypothetical protein
MKPAARTARTRIHVRRNYGQTRTKTALSVGPAGRGCKVRYQLLVPAP